MNGVVDNKGEVRRLNNDGEQRMNHHTTSKYSRVAVDTSFAGKLHNLLFRVNLLVIVIDTQDSLALLFLGHSFGTSHFDVLF